MAVRNGNIREKLIEAGINELLEHGLQGFSIRRIATACGVSCAAPYKHFHDKQDMIASVIGYINEIWNRRQLEVLKNCSGDSRARLVAVSVEYVRFLVENPHFRSILMTKDAEFDSMYADMRGKMTEVSFELVARYCAESGMTDEVRERKLYVVRSLIYGAALMIDNGQMEYNDVTMEYVRYNINREFELP